MLLLVPPRLWWPWMLRSCVRLLLAALLRQRPAPRRWVPFRARSHAVKAKASAADAGGDAGRHGRKKPDWVVHEVLRLATYLHSCRAVAAAFNALHGQRMTVGHSYVHALCRLRASELRLRRRGMRGCPPPAVPVGRAFSLDLTTVSAAGERCIVLGMIDQGSRMVVRLKVLAHKCTWSLLGHLCLAIAEHGLPAAVRADNERMFTGRVWKAALKWFGIRREHVDVRSPWQNGRIERFFGTLKPLLAKLSLRSPMALQGSLDEFALFFNHVRVHQNLGGLTPAQAWRGLSVADVRRCAGQGRWVQAFDGLLVGYHLRC